MLHPALSKGLQPKTLACIAPAARYIFCYACSTQRACTPTLALCAEPACSHIAKRTAGSSSKQAAAMCSHRNNTTSSAPAGVCSVGRAWWRLPCDGHHAISHPPCLPTAGAGELTVVADQQHATIKALDGSSKSTKSLLQRGTDTQHTDG